MNATNASVCKRGHPRTPENVRHPSGQCRLCELERRARLAAQRRQAIEAEVARSMEALTRYE